MIGLFTTLITDQQGGDVVIYGVERDKAYRRQTPWITDWRQ